MPHMLRLKATCQPWEAAVTGPEQIRFAKWAEKLGYEMIAVPEHHVVPAEHVELSGPHYFNAHAGMACFAGATERIRVNSRINILPLQHPIVTATSLSTIAWLSVEIGRASCSARVCQYVKISVVAVSIKKKPNT